MPLPSLSSLWSGDVGGGQTARKSNSRVDVDPNGKSRLRNFRPRPGEILDSFQFSNNVQLSALPTSIKPTPATIMTDKEPTNIHPPPANTVFASRNGYFQNAYSDPRIEKGGFIPILPGRKGYFTPIKNPFSVSKVNSTDSSDIQETASMELKPNNLEFDDDASDDTLDTKFPVLVPTVNADFAKNSSTLQNQLLPQMTSPRPQSHFNVSTLRKGGIVTPTKSSNGIHLIRSTASPKKAVTVITSTTTTAAPIPITTRHSALESTSSYESISTDRFRENENAQAAITIQKKFNKTQKSPAFLSPHELTDIIIATTPFYPTFSPHANDVINLSKNRSLPNRLTTSPSGITSGSALSALVAPGAQQGIFRPAPGRSVITKVFNNTAIGSSLTSSPTPIPFHSTSSVSSSTSMKLSSTTTIGTTTKLPTAEEYLRTTSQDNSIRETTTSNNYFDTRNDLEDQSTQYKGDMNWYFNNYNRSTWKEKPQHDSSLYKYRTYSTSGCFSTPSSTYSTIVTLTLILATQFFLNIFVVEIHSQFV